MHICPDMDAKRAGQAGVRELQVNMLLVDALQFSTYVQETKPECAPHVCRLARECQTHGRGRSRRA